MTLKAQRLRMAWVTVGSLVLTIGVCATLPRSIVTWDRTVNAFVLAEQDIRAAFKQIATRAENKELSNQEFVERFESQVLQRWRQARERFDNADIGKLPARAQRHYDALSQYVKITDEYWETYYNYMRATEAHQAEDYERKLAEIRKRREAQAF